MLKIVHCLMANIPFRFLGNSRLFGIARLSYHPAIIIYQMPWRKSIILVQLPHCGSIICVLN